MQCTQGKRMLSLLLALLCCHNVASHSSIAVADQSGWQHQQPCAQRQKPLYCHCFTLGVQLSAGDFHGRCVSESRTPVWRQTINKAVCSLTASLVAPSQAVTCAVVGGTLAERQVLGKRRREQLGLETTEAAMPHHKEATAAVNPAAPPVAGPANNMMAKMGYMPGAPTCVLSVCLSVCLQYVCFRMCLSAWLFSLLFAPSIG